MTSNRIQNLRSLRDEMKTVACGARPAPADAAKPSFNSVEAVARLLTPENGSSPSAATTDPDRSRRWPR